MTDISIQFHALREEVLDLVQQWVSEYGLHIVKISFPPYSAEEIDSCALASIASDPLSNELALTVAPPILPARGNMQFCDNNPDALHLNIGKQTSDGLKESHLSARCDSEYATLIWRQLARRVKAITRSGVTAVNQATGATAKFKSARYTNAAKELEASGVPMLTITGVLVSLGLDSEG